MIDTAFFCVIFINRTPQRHPQKPSFLLGQHSIDNESKTPLAYSCSICLTSFHPTPCQLPPPISYQQKVNQLKHSLHSAQDVGTGCCLDYSPYNLPIPISLHSRVSLSQQPLSTLTSGRTPEHIVFSTICNQFLHWCHSLDNYASMEL